MKEKWEKGLARKKRRERTYGFAHDDFYSE